MLGSHSDGIEVSYNAAGIICHILFDGNDLSKYVKPNNQVSQTVSQPTDQTFRMMDSTDSEDEETTESHPANRKTGVLHFPDSVKLFSAFKQVP